LYIGSLYRAHARTADPDRIDARLQLAGDVHRDGPGRDRGCRSLVHDLPRPAIAGAGTTGRGVSALESSGELRGLAASIDVAVPLSRDVGADARRLLHRLHHLDVPDLAAGLSRDAAAHQHRQDRPAGL